MIKTIILTIPILFLSGCVNKHGVSAKYYSDCEEYYDMQGFYHKKCGDDDIITYKKIGESSKKVLDYVTGEDEKPKGNVW